MRICQGSIRSPELYIEEEIQKYGIMRLVQVDVSCNKVQRDRKRRSTKKKTLPKRHIIDTTTLKFI